MRINEHLKMVSTCSTHNLSTITALNSTMYSATTELMFILH